MSLFRGELVVVVGFGASGRAAAEVLAGEGARVRVTESRPLADLGEVPDGIEVRSGSHRPEDLDGASLVVASPGVSESAPILRWAQEQGLPVWSELELGARLCRVPYCAVTGTNGKTTTTEMLAAIMRAAGRSAVACGNVGHPFSLAAREEHDALAVEASSFQLRFQESLRPRVSVLLNVAPDHLDWHGSFEAYAAAKARIYAGQGSVDVHVGNRDDPEAEGISKAAPCEVRWFRWGRPEEAQEVGVLEGAIVDGRGRTLARPAFVARPFLADAAAAAAAALAFGLPPDAIGDALARFEPLPHRGTVVARAGGVRFVDDSKATNPHAALAALDGLTDVVLIAGGLSKGVDLTPLVSAAPSLSAIVAIGEAAPSLARLFRGRVRVSIAERIEEAVEMAFGEAGSDGTVLLAPACASQDMFRDYRERGDRFAAAARRVAARAAQPRRSHA